MTVLMIIEGVLKTDVGDPIPEGFKLYRTLLSSYRVVLSSTSDLKYTEHWLKTNYLFDYADILTDKNFYGEQNLRMRHLELAKQGGKVELYIDADPDNCAEALSTGVPTILFATPKYFKTHREIRPWDVITQEQERQKVIVAEKYKFDSETDGQRWE